MGRHQPGCDRFERSRKGGILKENNIAKLDDQPWDDNVKAVAAIPALIAQMDANLDWTINLGQAFIEQPKELMDTIQMLRAKAQKAGTLQSTPQQVITVTNMVVEKTIEQQVVVVTNTVVQIQPANPQVVYVPSYPSTVYYPPPGYVYDPWAPLVTFGAGIAVGAIIANKGSGIKDRKTGVRDEDLRSRSHLDPFPRLTIPAALHTLAGTSEWELNYGGCPPDPQAPTSRTPLF